MARISDMLLTTQKKEHKLEGNGEAERKAVEAYKNLIENRTSMHGSYERDEQIGWVGSNEDGEFTHMALIGIHSQKAQILTIKFEGGPVTISDLRHFIEQEGLYINEVTQLGVPTSYAIRIR